MPDELRVPSLGVLGAPRTRVRKIARWPGMAARPRAATPVTGYARNGC